MQLSRAARARMSGAMPRRGVGLTGALASEEETAVAIGEAHCLWREADPWEPGSNPGDLGPEPALLTMMLYGQRAASDRAGSRARPGRSTAPACLLGVTYLCVPPPLSICQL